jgi:hypothetical protein
MKKNKLLLLMSVLLLSLCFAKTNDNYDYLTIPNALLAMSEDRYIYWFNIIASKNYEVTDELYETIINNGGTRFVKGYRFAKIIEVSKKNKNIVRIKYQIDYSDDFTTDFWTHRYSLISVAEYKKRFL